MMGNEVTAASQNVDWADTRVSPMPLWKRALDLTCIVVTLPIWAPMILLLGTAIKCLSPGPILFRHERVGYRGRRFECYKFRTMKVNADTGVHRQHLADLMKSDVPMVKMDSKGDTRLIPLGRFLRATGLDELPQIFNTLKGEMSLVGPRPCLPYEYENYQAWQKRRFEAMPGLTGLWQVSGKNRTTFSEMMFLDIFYAENKSLLLDLTIMTKTGPALISQIVETRQRKKRASTHGSETVKLPHRGRKNRNAAEMANSNQS